MSDQGGSNEAGWQPDPHGRHEYRYWDGTAWTDQVSDGGVVSTDPPGDATTVTPAATPPVADPTTTGMPVAGPPSTEAPPYVAPTEEKPKGKLPVGLLALVGLAVAAIVAALVIFLGGGDDDGGTAASDVSDDVSSLSDLSDLSDELPDLSDFSDDFSDLSDFSDLFSDFSDFSDDFSDFSDFSDDFSDFSDFDDDLIDEDIGPIEIGDAIDGFVDTGTRDLYEFEGTGDLVSIAVIGSYEDGGLDPVVTVLDSSGATIDSDDDGNPEGIRNSLLEITLDAGETYTIAVSGYTTSSGEYTVSVS